MHTPPVKQLRRTRQGRIIAGVCSGVAEYTGIDANILRVALVVASFFGGLGIGVYAVAWLLVPEEGKNDSIVQDLIDRQKAKGMPGHWQRPGDAWQDPTVYRHDTAYRHDAADAPAPAASRPAEPAPAANRPAEPTPTPSRPADDRTDA